MNFAIDNFNRLQSLVNQQTITNEEQGMIYSLTKECLKPKDEYSKSVNNSIEQLQKIYNRNKNIHKEDSRTNSLIKKIMADILVSKPEPKKVFLSLIEESNTTKESYLTSEDKKPVPVTVPSELVIAKPSINENKESEKLQSIEPSLAKNLEKAPVNDVNHFKADIEKTIENLGSFLTGLKSRGAGENQDQLKQDYDRQINSAETIKSSITKQLESIQKKKSESEFESHLLPLIVEGTNTLCTTTSTLKLPIYADYFGIKYRFKSLDTEVTSICITIKPAEKQDSLLASSASQETLNTPSNTQLKKKLEDMLDDARKLNADIVVFKENLLVKKYCPSKFSNFLSHLVSYSCDETKLKEMNEKYKNLKNQQAYYTTHGKILLTESQLKEFNSRLVKFSSRLTEVETLLRSEQKTTIENSDYQFNPVLAELKSLHDQIVIAKENFILEKEWVDQLSSNERKIRYEEIITEFKELESLKEKAIDAKDSIYSTCKKQLNSILESQTKELVDMNLKLTVINKTITEIQNQFIKIMHPTPKGSLSQTVSSAFNYLTGSKS